MSDNTMDDEGNTNLSEAFLVLTDTYNLLHDRLIWTYGYISLYLDRDKSNMPIDAESLKSIQNSLAQSIDQISDTISNLVVAYNMIDGSEDTDNNVKLQEMAVSTIKHVSQKQENISSLVNGVIARIVRLRVKLRRLVDYVQDDGDDILSDNGMLMQTLNYVRDSIIDSLTVRDVSRDQ